jgi:hypothetical protein
MASTDSDIIIQSRDLVNIRVHKSALSSSSPFFDDLFLLPRWQPLNSEIVNGLPVVRLSEDTEVLNSLLTVLYPIPSLILETNLWHYLPNVVWTVSGPVFVARSNPENFPRQLGQWAFAYMLSQALEGSHLKWRVRALHWIFR